MDGGTGKMIYVMLNPDFCSTHFSMKAAIIHLFPPSRVHRSFQQAAKLVPEADGGIPERQCDGPDYVLEERPGSVRPD